MNSAFYGALALETAGSAWAMGTICSALIIRRKDVTYRLFSLMGLGLFVSFDDTTLFKNTNEYQLIRGAFQALGFLDVDLEGELADEQVFDVNNGY